MPEKVERKALSGGLAKLNENMGTMAQLAELAIRKATAGLVERDQRQVDEVFSLDQEIYALREEIVKSCVELIALHAPVARDLRTITMFLETTTDLDRIGRYAKDIAEVTERLRRLRPDPHDAPANGLVRMTELTIQMVHTAVDAFVHGNVEPVRDIDRADDVVDSVHDDVFQSTVDSMAERTLPVEVGAFYILVNRYLERISDHAVNIGEHTLYMVTGQRTRGKGLPLRASV